jgi:hypothetical protein
LILNLTGCRAWLRLGVVLGGIFVVGLGKWMSVVRFGTASP